MFAPQPEEIESELGGPVFETEPAEVIGDITGVIEKAASTLDDDDVAALMGIADTKGNVKAAFVMRAGKGWTATAWYERQDGDNTFGVGVIKRWKR